MTTRRARARTALAGGALAIMLVSSSCSGASAPASRSQPAVRIASFDFPESVLLAHLYAEALRANGFPVAVNAGVGAREVVDPALIRGLVDVVPEYAGSALQFLTPGGVEPGADLATTRAGLARLLESRRIHVLASAPAADANAIVVTESTARRYGLTRLEDLRAVAGQLVFGGPPECPQRPLCLPGLRSVYGISFRSFVPLDADGPLTHDALLAGQVDVAKLYTTDPTIATRGLVVLEDDLGLQPAENVTPLVRAAVLDRYGSRLSDVLDAVSSRLTTEELRALNAEVSLRGGSPAGIARRWLASQGIE